MFERIAPEQHDTLEGVPEPSENPRLHGHRAASTVLAMAYRAGKLPHALLLAGPRGVGKATLAFHLANHLLRHPAYGDAPGDLVAPDTTSPLFRQVAMAAHPGVLHLTRPFNEKTKTFKTVVTVDEIRRVSRFLSMTSHDGGYRVVIVDSADDMNVNAANALLKNLEEPPARTIFVLIAHALGSLLPTIRSRCQIVRLGPLEPNELMAALQGAGQEPPRDARARTALATRAAGSVREAILLTQYGGLEIAEAMDKIAVAPKLDVAAAHKLAEVAGGRGQDIPFDIFNRHALDLLADAASRAALEGQGLRANRLTESWNEALNAVTETQTYNLDKKQHALGMIIRLNEALRM